MPQYPVAPRTRHFIGDDCPGGHPEAIAVSPGAFISSIETEEHIKELKEAALQVKDQLKAAEALLSALPGWSDIPENHRAKTPARFVAMLLELTTKEEFEFTTFQNENEKSEMISVGPIPFVTLCAHHVVPFYGSAYIGYVPEDLVAGLSKFARLVRQTSKGLWTQEALTSYIADQLYGHLDPKGVAVVLRAEHMCMSIRGVKQPGVITTTSDMRGVFADHSRLARQEFFELVGLHN
jgi:GTP cyclohydrolase I